MLESWRLYGFRVCLVILRMQCFESKLLDTFHSSDVYLGRCKNFSSYLLICVRNFGDGNLFDCGHNVQCKQLTINFQPLYLVVALQTEAIAVDTLSCT
jgi:hypothetical protein